MLLPRFSTSLLAAGAAALVALSSVDASAQDATGDAVSGTGKGIVGGALLGGEVVTITMGIIGVEDGWPYFVFGGLGAVAGGLGGFGVESAVEASGPAEAPLYMLAGGLTLLVPALVISLNATSQDEPIGELDEEPTDEPPAADPSAPPAGGGGAVKVDVTSRRAPVRRAPAVAAARPASKAPRMTAVDLREGDLALGLPAVSVRPLYSAQELSRYGVPQGTEVRVPVLGASF